MFQVGRKAAQLERTKLQSEIRKEQSEIRRRTLQKRIKMASSGKKGGPTKNPRKQEEDDDDDVLEDLVVDSNKKAVSYSSLTPGGFVTKKEDRGGRLTDRRARIAAREKDDDDDDDDDEENEKEKLERETRELQSELQKAERAVQKARDQEEKEKARRFSKRIQSGIFKNQPQAVSLVPQKKRRKTLKIEQIKSADEQDEEDEIPEGFHLQEESPHCINMTRSEDFQAYLRQLILEYERMLKAGTADMKAEYGKIIESFYWALKANKQTICTDAVPADVLASIKDSTCKAWKLKLDGRQNVDPTTLVLEPAVAPQRASEAVSFKPDEILEAVKSELEGKTDLQKKELRITIANMCRSQALAHRHAADAADHLVTLTDVASIPVVLTVMNAVQRPVVAVRIPEVDDMMAKAQEKVDAIRRAKARTAGVSPIDEVVFAQNVPTYNPEWEHSAEGRATSYLATLVCRYMNELQRKDKKVVLSAKALEAIYKMASSSVGKLISGKQYLGGYAMEQQRSKVQATGKELKYKRTKKLQTKDTAIPSTSAMEH